MNFITVKKTFLFLIGLGVFAVMASAEPKKDSRQNWSKEWGPLVPHKTFPKDCSLCHLPKRWDVLRKDFHFDHGTETGYPLEGAHAHAACLRCHNDRGAVSAYTSRGCGGCHSDPHNKTMGVDCTRCHTQNTWQSTKLLSDHARTQFPLTGMHIAVQCVQCHIRADIQDYHGAPTDCYSCHQQSYQQAPKHAALNFPHKCQGCHNTSTWSGAQFNHSFLGNTSDCYSCHASDFQRGPNHTAMNYSHACLNCHNTTSWSAAQVNHSAFNNATDCYSCHASDFSQGQSHVSLNFPHTCLDCHTTASWSSTHFVHNFPINSGNHNANCTICHNGGTTTTFTCFVCHEHNQTTTNSHHQNVTNYQYNSLACFQCHPNGRH